MKGTPLATANDIAFAVIFTVCRMVCGPFLLYATVMSPTSHVVVKVRVNRDLLLQQARTSTRPGRCDCDSEHQHPLVLEDYAGTGHNTPAAQAPVTVVYPTTQVVFCSMSSRENKKQS